MPRAPLANLPLGRVAGSSPRVPALGRILTALGASRGSACHRIADAGASGPERSGWVASASSRPSTLAVQWPSGHAGRLASADGRQRQPLTSMTRVCARQADIEPRGAAISTLEREHDSRHHGAACGDPRRGLRPGRADATGIAAHPRANGAHERRQASLARARTQWAAWSRDGLLLAAPVARRVRRPAKDGEAPGPVRPQAFPLVAFISSAAQHSIRHRVVACFEGAAANDRRSGSGRPTCQCA